MRSWGAGNHLSREGPVAVQLSQGDATVIRISKEWGFIDRFYAVVDFAAKLLTALGLEKGMEGLYKMTGKTPINAKKTSVKPNVRAPLASPHQKKKKMLQR